MAVTKGDHDVATDTTATQRLLLIATTRNKLLRGLRKNAVTSSLLGGELDRSGRHRFGSTDGLPGLTALVTLAGLMHRTLLRLVRILLVLRRLGDAIDKTTSGLPSLGKRCLAVIRGQLLGLAEPQHAVCGAAADAPRAVRRPRPFPRRASLVAHRLLPAPGLRRRLGRRAGERVYISMEIVRSACPLRACVRPHAPPPLHVLACDGACSQAWGLRRR